MNAAEFRKLLRSKNLSVEDAAKVAFKDRTRIYHYLREDSVPPGVVALIQAHPRSETKPRKPGWPGVWIKDRPQTKPKAKRNGRKA